VRAIDDSLRLSLADRYELRGELGRGGMSTVHLARDRRHDRDVAIKVLLPELCLTIGADRFRREIQLVARLQHPHILPLFDSGESDGLLYFVMPFIDGESLRARLDRDGALDLDDAVRLLRQVADALDYAHGRGVVHRDLKPENILLTGTEALLTDFGIARAPRRAEPGGETLTAVGMTLGTPAYMSPEQAIGEQEVDARSDVYGLGCLCYELVSGRPPFVSSNAIGIIRQHLVSAPPPLTSTREAIPAAISAAVARALAKNPGERFARAGDFVGALERAAVEARQLSPDDVRLTVVQRQHEERRRVLVLEFTNLTRAVDADWLSTGIAETVSADLGTLTGVKVVGHDVATRRRIASALEGRPVDANLAAEMGRSVGAQCVVFGAFQKIGDRIRITPHFVDTRDGSLMGGEKIDGPMNDIFALQDRIVTALTDSLRLRLTSSELARLEQPPTAHLDAYEHYSRGYRGYRQFGKESVKSAAEHFRAAIAIDPNYALAYAGLGSIHGPMYIASGKREVLDEGVRLLERAIALDASLGEAHAWLAYMQFRQGRFHEAVEIARRGVEHDPTSDTVWYMLGCSHLCRAFVAHEPEAMAASVPPYLRCVALNPRNLPAWMALGSIYLMRGQHSHAKLAIDRAVALEREGGGLLFLGALVQRAVLHMAAGELEAAGPLLDQAIERYTTADHVYSETMSAYALVTRGCLGERLGKGLAALRDFDEAWHIADANEHRIAIGAHFVKGRLGRVRVLHRMGQVREADEVLGEATELFAGRSRFVWTWIQGATDADVLYDLASTLATLGRAAEALEVLGRAAGTRRLP
jgi:serine/threonine-protein kinase